VLLRMQYALLQVVVPGMLPILKTRISLLSSSPKAKSRSSLDRCHSRLTSHAKLIFAMGRRWTTPQSAAQANSDTAPTLTELVVAAMQAAVM